MSAPAASVAAVREVLRAHNIECTSKATGEVSCRGCRDEGWMSYTKYHEHVAVAAADAAVQAATPGIQAGALRKFADTRGVDVGDGDDAWWRGYRQAQRECLRDAMREADRIEARP